MPVKNSQNKSVGELPPISEQEVEFLEVLEDNDDVQRVTANYEMSEETLKQLAG